eukprot:GHVL01026608.1.p1 GENE.GHVL01026608.1~~GHVL01026608.1.p1  ORF type:complete len:273 (-),score=48.78 GHVL01026608.1:793-1611(-)
MERQIPVGVLAWLRIASSSAISKIWGQKLVELTGSREIALEMTKMSDIKPTECQILTFSEYSTHVKLVRNNFCGNQEDDKARVSLVFVIFEDNININDHLNDVGEKVFIFIGIRKMIHDGQLECHDLDYLIANILIQHKINVVEVSNHSQAVDYLCKCAEAVRESFGRKLPSRFETRGKGCTVIRKGVDRNTNEIWLSQLMQLPGVSEDVAETVAAKHPLPMSLVRMVNDPKAKDLYVNQMQDEIIHSSLKSTSRRLGQALAERLEIHYYCS